MFLVVFCLAFGMSQARADDDPDGSINGNITQHSSFLTMNQAGRLPLSNINGFNSNNSPFNRFQSQQLQQSPFGFNGSPFQQQQQQQQLSNAFPGLPPTGHSMGLNALQSGGVKGLQNGPFGGQNQFNSLANNNFQQQQQPGSFGSANTLQNQLAFQSQLALLAAQQQQGPQSNFFLPQQQLQNAGLLAGQSSQLNSNNLLLQNQIPLQFQNQQSVNNPFGTLGLLALQQQVNPFVLQSLQNQQQPFGTSQLGLQQQIQPQQFLGGLQQQQQQQQSPFANDQQLSLLALQQLQQQNPLVFQQLQQQQNPFISSGIGGGSNSLQSSFGQQQQGNINNNDFNGLSQNNRFPSSNSNQILLQGGQFTDPSPFANSNSNQGVFSSNNNRFPNSNNNNANRFDPFSNQRQPFNSFGTSNSGQHQQSFFNDRALNSTSFNPQSDSVTTFNGNPFLRPQSQLAQSPFAVNPQQDALFFANDNNAVAGNPFLSGGGQQQQQWNVNQQQPLPFFASGSINNPQMLRGGGPSSPPVRQQQSELSLNSLSRPMPNNNSNNTGTDFNCDGRVPGSN